MESVRRSPHLAIAFEYALVLLPIILCEICKVDLKESDCSSYWRVMIGQIKPSMHLSAANCIGQAHVHMRREEGKEKNVS